MADAVRAVSAGARLDGRDPLGATRCGARAGAVAQAEIRPGGRRRPSRRRCACAGVGEAAHRYPAGDETVQPARVGPGGSGGGLFVVAAAGEQAVLPGSLAVRE
ncbi:hypothetical protein NKH18_33355 [Streptomyces sp. M10(2022)]